MRLDLTLETQLPDSYRAARTRSLFNVTPDQAATHRIGVDLPIEERPWSIGVIVGPSGSGKTSVGRHIFGDESTMHQGFTWPDDLPIVEAIGPEATFDEVTNALAAVGLGTVPSWLRPYRVLSRGEQFRADLARILIERPERIVVDEFTSVVDRQVATIGAGAFAKAWRRSPNPGQAVLLTPHYDVLDWLQPDWVLDTKDWAWTWGLERRRPPIQLEVVETGWGAWPLFEPHHYLKLPRAVAAINYVGLVEDEPVAHLAVSTMGSNTRGKLGSARFTRLVVMPEWQGAGVGLRFLDWIAEEWYRGRNRYGVRLTGIMHTSHPGLVAALRRSPRWVQSQVHLLGAARDSGPMTRRPPGSNRPGYKPKVKVPTHLAGTKLSELGFTGPVPTAAYGGHLRAVQGFRYIGDRT